MKVISIVTAKGGVGKTTTAVEIGTNLNLLGKRTLLIDFDHQGDSTRSIDGNKEATIYDALTVEKPFKDCIQHTPYFDLIASSNKLNGAEKVFTDRDDVFLLKDAIEIVENDYDYVIIDNNPDIGTLFAMSVVASDYVIIPTECDENSLAAVDNTTNALKKLTDGRSHESNAKVLAMVLTKKEKTSMHEIALETLEEKAASHKDAPFVFTITKAIRISEAKLLREPVSSSQKGSPQAREYYELTKKIVEKTEV